MEYCLQIGILCLFLYFIYYEFCTKYFNYFVQGSGINSLNCYPLRGFDWVSRDVEASSFFHASTLEDLSPIFFSGNDGIHAEHSSVHYGTIQNAITLVKAVGQNCFLAKNGIKMRLESFPFILLITPF